MNTAKRFFITTPYLATEKTLAVPMRHETGEDWFKRPESLVDLILT
jgi:hypothetical protein